MFREETLRAIEAHAIEDVPRECCGLVVMVDGKEVYVRCRNLAEKEEDFKLSAEDWADAEDMGEIAAIVHSHPDESAEPTDADKLACEEQGIPWVIVSVRDGKVCDKRVITPEGWKAPLVGRNFFHGVLDCYTLVKDWYEREEGITLPEAEREDDWWDKGQNLYLDNFERAGFRKLKDGEAIQESDVILMQIRSKVPNHAGVYIGSRQIKESPELHKVYDAFIHHLCGRLSSREIYGGFWRDCTTHILRHKDLEK